MNIIITGVTSFIGIHLTKLLLAEGHHVIGICRDIKKAEKSFLKYSQLEIICLDMEHICNLFDKVNCDIDVFIHLAWNGAGHEGRNNKLLQEENVKQSLEALYIAERLESKLFVLAGSQAEYGLVSGILTPETSCNPENEYGRAKLKFAIEAEKYCSKVGMKFIHLRILSIYGEGDKDWTMIMNCTKKMLRNEDVPLSNCTQLWNYVYIKDAVKQIYLLCQNALSNENFDSEIYLIASKDTRPLHRFIEEIYLLTNSRSQLRYGYYKPLNIVELNPDISKTERATHGFISDYTFSDGMKAIIESLK